MDFRDLREFSSHSFPVIKTTRQFPCIRFFSSENVRGVPIAITVTDMSYIYVQLSSKFYMMFKEV